LIEGLALGDGELAAVQREEGDRPRNGSGHLAFETDNVDEV